MGDFTPRRQFRKDKMNLILIGAGILALIIFFAVVFPKNRGGPDTDIEVPDTRIGSSDRQVVVSEETRIGSSDRQVVVSEESPAGKDLKSSEAEEIENRIERLERRDKSLERMTERLDELEKTLGARLAHIEKVLNNLQKKAVTQNRKKTTAPIKPVPESRKRTHTRYHQVQPGDTLYQISRTYGLPVDVVRQLNNLGPDDAIHPGQKLIVGR